ncbi:MAG: folylpolyglutamate synthase/dihydrofolate synthase family protein [Candidatus Acidiferrales bacterium]
MNYEESVHALLSLGKELGAPRQPARNSPATPSTSIPVQKFGLENIAILAEDLGRPHCVMPCAHIAGTNGKGSTAAMLESILRVAGLRTGLYTSPHLELVNERIRINGESISDQDFATAWTGVSASIESLMASGKLSAHPTFFECITAMAFLTFAAHHVGFAIYEVGMGGRFDATNIVRPEVAVITPIDFDHENYLGHSIEEISAEKAGIIKANAWVVSAAQRPEARSVIARRCVEMNARLVEVDTEWRIEDLKTSAGFYSAAATCARTSQELAIAPALSGRFQVQNALTAATAARLLSERGFRIGYETIERGIATAHWPGRLERISERPDVYLDGTHNPAGARELLRFWEDNFSGRRIFLVYGAMRDKAVDEIAGLLFPRAEAVILTMPRQSRAISASLLSEITGHFAKNSIVVPDPGDALDRAMELAGPEDVVFATGSLYLVGDIRGLWRTRTSKRASSERPHIQASGNN